MAIRSTPVLALLACVFVLAGCGSSAKLTPGRGLYWTWTEEKLQTEGYPGYEESYSSNEWGVLYDDDGVAYGPRAFYHGRERQEHPYLTVTDSYLESRWIRLYQSACCTEPLMGHFLEIMDLAWKDTTENLGFVPDRKLSVYSPVDTEDYQRTAGVEIWVTHLVVGASIVVEPVDILFRRTLAAHTAYAAVAQALLDLQTRGRIPMWLREGISSYLAQEGYEHLSFMAEFRARAVPVLMTPLEVERNVYPLVDRQQGRIARYNAFLMVWTLSERYGWDRIRELLSAVHTGASFEDAVRQVYGMGVDELLVLLDPTVNGEPTLIVPPPPARRGLSG